MSTFLLLGLQVQLPWRVKVTLLKGPKGVDIFSYPLHMKRNGTHFLEVVFILKTMMDKVHIT
jgi:hypothetical protein